MELESPDSLAYNLPVTSGRKGSLGLLILRFLLPLAERGGGALNIDIFPAFVPLL